MVARSIICLPSALTASLNLLLIENFFSTYLLTPLFLVFPCLGSFTDPDLEVFPPLA